MVDYEYLFTKNLKRLRNEHKLTQEQLADLCNTSDTMISFYENGVISPKLCRIVELASALDVPLVEFFRE